jgi:hypothetical protein
MPAQQLNTSLQWMMAEPNPLQETLQLLINSKNKEDLPKNTWGPSKNKISRLEGEMELHEDYFLTNTFYSRMNFKERFQIPSTLFGRISKDLAEHDKYFVQNQVSLLILLFS